MAIAFYPGQSLGQNDLKISIRDSSAVLIDPYYIRYMLLDNTTGAGGGIPIGPSDRIPATTGVGQYYVDATLPLDSNIGDWVVRWNFRETATSPLVQVAQEFAVVKIDVVTNITNSTTGDLLVRRLRILLRDNNPDRNYSVSGNEEIEVDAGGVMYTTTMEDLYNIIQEGLSGNL
jgi:hypothetical protein